MKIPTLWLYMNPLLHVANTLLIVLWTLFLHFILLELDRSGKVTAKRYWTWVLVFNLTFLHFIFITLEYLITLIPFLEKINRKSFLEAKYVVYCCHRNIYGDVWYAWKLLYTIIFFYRNGPLMEVIGAWVFKVTQK